MARECIHFSENFNFWVNYSFNFTDLWVVQTSPTSQFDQYTVYTFLLITGKPSSTHSCAAAEQALENVHRVLILRLIWWALEDINPSKKTREESSLASFPEEQFLYKQNQHQFQSTGIRRTTHRKFREKHRPVCNFSDWTVPELQSERLILLAGCCVWHGELEQTDKPWHAAPRRESNL